MESELNTQRKHDIGYIGMLVALVVLIVLAITLAYPAMAQERDIRLIWDASPEVEHRIWRNGEAVTPDE